MNAHYRQNLLQALITTLTLHQEEGHIGDFTVKSDLSSLTLEVVSQKGVTGLGETVPVSIVGGWASDDNIPVEWTEKDNAQANGLSFTITELSTGYRILIQTL